MLPPAAVGSGSRLTCRVGGRWLIERATIAELLAGAGVHVPPP